MGNRGGGKVLEGYIHEKRWKDGDWFNEEVIGWVWVDRVWVDRVWVGV